MSCTFTNTEQSTIEIVKATVGADGTFDFIDATAGDPLGDFSVTTVGGTVTETFEDVVPGVYTIRETVPVTGWDLTDIVCSSTATPASTFTYAGASVSPTAGFEPGDNRATITLAPGDDTVSCEFTNTERGTIDVTKTTVGGTGEFAFTENTTGSAAGFVLDTEFGDDSENLTEVPGENTYTVTETVPVGWDVTNIVCLGASEFAFQPSDEATFQPGDTSVEIDLAAGDSAGCTFENTERGTIDIVKTTDGGDGTFTFTDDIPASGGFTIDTSETNTETFENVVPDTYVVTESREVGWDLTGIACTSTGGSTFTYTGNGGVDTDAFEQGDNSANITLAAGDDTVSCDFTNVERGTIDIVKTTDGGDGTFTFTDDIPASGGFTIDTSETNTETFENVVPDTYTVTETAEIGWDLTGIACTSTGGSTFTYTGNGGVDTDAFEQGDNSANITLAAGDDTVSCDFTNVERGTIDIVKTTDGGDGTFTFTDDIPASGGFTIDTSETNTETFENVVPDTYTVTETARDRLGPDRDRMHLDRRQHLHLHRQRRRRHRRLRTRRQLRQHHPRRRRRHRELRLHQCRARHDRDRQDHRRR